MVDDTTLIVITSVAQTLVITLTLAVFVFQFRSQERAIKGAAYQNVQSHYTDYVRMLVEKPELARMMFEFRDAQESLTSKAKVEPLSSDEQLAFSYLMLGYGIFEEVYNLHKKNWIDGDEWDQWVAFLKSFSKHPLFRRVHQRTLGMFDSDFQDLVTQIMD
ncbi:MAG: hypothetical protein OK456_11035 [Thaumarchaeota archaeon]|nr:hypothetical protein [Nitrososphaerota archaeon]